MRLAIAVAFVATLLTHSSDAVGQSSERLQRPFPESEMGADGRLVTSFDKTLGQMAVDSYARYGRIIYGRGGNPHDLADAYRDTPLCNRQGTGGFVADRLRVTRRDLSTEQRAALRAKDPAALTDLAIDVIAHLDGVSAEAIRADEAMGPGVYTDAIRGLSFGIDVCDFYGRRP